MIKSVEVHEHSDGGWTVYLVREDGMLMSCAYSVNYPGQTGMAVAASWRSFLGLPEPVEGDDAAQS